MKVIITGKGGQLAWELERTIPVLDISNQALVNQFITNEKPDVVINATAYTAVDKAEEDIEVAYDVNEKGVRYLAEACQKINARILHVSTDFVFDGSNTTPYQTGAMTNPVNVYGASKLAGDNALQNILPERSVIVRTAWVYSVHGHNFVKSMLRLMENKPQLGIVYDQVGTPTWARGLAAWLWAIVEKPEVKGVYHWTDAGVASWYDFAIAIQELGIEKGLLKKAIPVLPIPSSAYPTPAKRPAFSVIDKTSAEEVSSLNTIHWRKQLSLMMDELTL